MSDIVRHGLRVFSREADLLIAEIVALGGEQELRERYGAFYWGPPSFIHGLDSLHPIPPDFVAELRTARARLEHERRRGGWEVDRLLAEAHEGRDGTRLPTSADASGKPVRAAEGVRVRVRSRGRFGRARYELDLPTGRKTTRRPVTLLDSYVGVGDAWALVRAADAAWDGTTGEWVSLSESR